MNKQSIDVQMHCYGKALVCIPEPVEDYYRLRIGNDPESKLGSEQAICIYASPDQVREMYLTLGEELRRSGSISPDTDHDLLAAARALIEEPRNFEKFAQIIRAADDLRFPATVEIIPDNAESPSPEGDDEEADAYDARERDRNARVASRANEYSDPFQDD